jgi:hypothetical protein
MTDDFTQKYPVLAEKMRTAGWTVIGEARGDGRRSSRNETWGLIGIARPYDEDDDYEGPVRISLWTQDGHQVTFGPDPDAETALREWLNEHLPREL